ncbi:MAG: hypothetical protein ACLP7Q_08895 [Isosphaeraceae bacterium]
MDPLQMSLLDLHHKLHPHDIPLIIGGGLGLVLKRQQIEKEGLRTLFDQLPKARSTNDIDLFFRAEIVADSGRVQIFVAALAKLGYVPLEKAKYLQWVRTVVVVGIPQEIKLDLLVGPIDDEFRDALHIKGPRVRPKGKNVTFHAYRTEEAIEIQKGLMPVDLAGRLSGGESHTARVFVPQAFTYLMMKLHAFDDRKDESAKDESDKQLGRHHSLDLYASVAMMTENEYDRAVRLGQVYGDHSPVKRSRGIVAESFAALSAPGMIRLREHALYRPDFNLTEFMEVLGKIFGDQGNEGRIPG